MKKIIVFISLLSIFYCFNLSIAEEMKPTTPESKSEIEKDIIQQAEEQKEAQLKEYFREYYYRQGRQYFKKHSYKEAVIEFENALSWDPLDESALRMLELSKIKVAVELPPTERKRTIEEIKRESQERNREGFEAEKKAKEEEKIAKEEVKALTGKEGITTPQAPFQEVTYHIEKGDTLEISVWRYPELRREVLVRPDGKISFLLVGDIEAAGFTPPELGEKIRKELSEFAKRRLKPSISDKPEEKLGYLIGLGDRIDVSVWRVPDLSKEVIVRPDGKISFPLLGDLQATGLTLVELDEQLTKGLSNYVKDPQVSLMVTSFGWRGEVPADVLLDENPQVTVMIKQFGARKVVVLGEVRNPGFHDFTGDIRLLEALALAGDCTKYAVKNNVVVIRGDIHKSPQVFKLNVIEILKHAKLEQNILIQPHDIVFVPRTLIGNINAFFEDIRPFLDTVQLGVWTKRALEND